MTVSEAASWWRARAGVSIENIEFETVTAVGVPDIVASFRSDEPVDRIVIESAGTNGRRLYRLPDLDVGQGEATLEGEAR